MIDDDIGTRIRAARTAQGLSLRGVASAIGVSASLLSLVENGRTKPSFGTLTALVGHFGISFDEVMGEHAVRPEPASALHGGPDHPYPVTYPPGASASGHERPDEGVGTEYVYLLAGELTVRVDEIDVVLRAGDSLSLDTARAREYRNDGAVPARVIRFFAADV